METHGVARRVFLGAMTAFALAGASFAEVRNVVVIGWDAAQRNHLKEMMERNELPNFQALAKDGALVEIDVTTGATDTKAGWTQIWTGCHPEKTGVYSNGRYQPIPEGMTVFERVEAALGKDAIDTVAVIGKKGHVDNDAPKKVPYDDWQKREEAQKKIDAAKPGRGNPQGGKVIEENGQKFVETLGKPWYNASRNMDLFVNGLEKNERVGARALEELDKRKDHRFLFFIHFAEPDHAGHKNGENSQAYTDAIRSDDEWTGKIIAKLKELGLYEKTLVYVVQDHGFNEDAKGHSYAPFLLYATNDKEVTRKSGTRADIAPTILKRFGIDLAKLDPPVDGVPLDVDAPERRAPEQPTSIAKKNKAGEPKAGKRGKKAGADAGVMPAPAGGAAPPPASPAPDAGKP
jgi:hypothetical protein